NGVSATARRTRLFLTTRKYTPEARALARSCVMAATGKPRFSAMTIACAPATSFATSATTACFCVRLRLIVTLVVVPVTSRPGPSCTRAPSAPDQRTESEVGGQKSAPCRLRLAHRFELSLRRSLTVRERRCHRARPSKLISLLVPAHSPALPRRLCARGGL